MTLPLASNGAAALKRLGCTAWVMALNTASFIAGALLLKKSTYDEAREQYQYCDREEPAHRH